MDIDGANQKQLTRESGGVPTFSISPDGRWVIYNPFVGGIRKVSIDGGEPVELVTKGSLLYPQVSPDGTLLAYFFDEEKTHRPKIAVVKFDDGSPVKTFGEGGMGEYETFADRQKESGNRKEKPTTKARRVTWHAFCLSGRERAALALLQNRPFTSG